MNRQEVARLAARLLYDRKVKEYKDAKEMAAASLGSKALPSNYEVAVELDGLTDQLERDARHTRLIEMRGIALSLMKRLRRHDPVLIGSVRRGTQRLGSDIDIVVYHGDPGEVEEEVSQLYPVTGVERKTFTMEGAPRNSTHINFMADGYGGEVVVRDPMDRDTYTGERCETYGDLKRGLTLGNLEKLMRGDPLRRFVPKRRVR